MDKKTTFILATVGLILFFISIFYILVVGATPVLYITLTVGFILSAFTLFLLREELFGQIKKQTVVSGSNSIILTIAVIGIIFVVYGILERHHKRFDLTANKLFSLSSQTEKILEYLKTPIKITVFAQDRGLEKKMIEDLLTEYKYHTKKISLEYYDPEKNPAIAERFNIKVLPTVIFESGKQKKDVTREEIFGISYGPGGGSGQEFNGEQAFTSAIIKVTGEKQKEICFLTGDGEKDYEDNGRDGFSGIKDFLEKENYILKKVNLYSEHKLPESCVVLVVAAPQNPILAEAENLIKKYINENAGKVMFLMDNRNSPSLPALLRQWGIEVGSSFIVDPKSSYFFDALTPIPLYLSHPIVDELSKNKIAVILPEARSVGESKNKVKGVEINPLLQTTDAAWGETNITEKKIKYDEGQDVKGPFTIAVSAIVWGKKQDKKDEGRIVAIGDSDFASNKAMRSRGNVDLFVNSINWLAKEEEKISIRAKTPDRRTIDLNPIQSKIILYFTLYLTPIMILFVGFVIWRIRRNL